MLAAVLALAQGPVVTLRLDGAHSNAVLAALSSQAGVTMRPAGEVTGDFLAVKLTSVPLEEAKRLLATTLDAEWVYREGVHYLDRGVKQKLRIKKEEDVGIRLSIAAFLEKNPDRPLDKEAIRKALIDFSDPKRVPSIQQEAMVTLQRFRPETRLGARVVRALGTELLVNVTDDRPLRFYQYADGTGNMNGGVKAAIKEMEDEQDTFTQISESLGGQNFFGARAIGQSTDYAVAVTRNRGTVRIQLYRHTSQSGQPTSTSSSEIASFNGRTNNGLAGPRPSVPPFEKPFELSAQGKSLVLCLIGDPARTREDTALATEAAKAFATTDPHRLYGAQPLIQAMRTLDYVALLPDSVLANPNWGRSQDLSQVWSLWSRNFAMGQDQKTKVVLARATNPYWSREPRYDRHAIARLAGEIDRAKRPTLDALGAFAFAMNDRTEFAATYRFLENVLALDRNPPDFIALKAWGGLNPSQKRSAQSGGYVVPFVKLPASVRDALAAELTSAGTYFSSQPTTNVMWSSNGRSFNGRTLSGSLFISGQVPPNAEVKFVVHRAMLLKPAPGPRNQNSGQLLTPEELARYSRSQPSEWSPDYKNATIVNAERLQVDVFSPGAGYSYWIAQIDDSNRDTQFVPLAQLPEPYRSQVAAALNRGGG
jgi:hypothetical protein